MSTVIFDDSYVLKRGEQIAFTDETAFDLIGYAEPSLTTNGAVTLTSSTSVIGMRVENTVSQAEIWNQKHGQIVMTGTGASTTISGFALYGQTEVRNDGVVEISAEAGDNGFYFWTAGIFTNAGRLSVASADAMAVAVENLVDVDNSGLIEAAGDTAWGVSLSDGFTLHNSGTIKASATLASAVRISGEFHNLGQILADSAEAQYAATGVDLGATGTEFDNSGTISASGGWYSVGIQLRAQTDAPLQTIDNSGRIYADKAIAMSGIPDWEGQLVVNNSGRIVGEIGLGHHDDVVHNTGRITGDVHMSEGADLYDGWTGKLSGAAYGEGGDDTLVGGKTAELLVGDSLPAWAFGSEDSLTGGGGADTLTGGANADVFVYLKTTDSTAARSDLITDLSDGDLIDLSRIDADITRGGNQAFRLVASLDGHAGEACLTYDALADQTRLRLDVDGDGKADAVIYLAGDHHDFAGLVL